MEEKAKNTQFLLDQLNKHREGRVETTQVADQDVEMISDNEGDHGSNPEYSRLITELQQMQRSWHEGRKRLQVDNEKDYSVTELFMDLKKTFLDSHQGVDIKIESS